MANVFKEEEPDSGESGDQGCTIHGGSSERRKTLPRGPELNRDMKLPDEGHRWG